VEQEQQEMAVVAADWVVVVVDDDDDSTLANAANQFAPLAGPRSEMREKIQICHFMWKLRAHIDENLLP
jgi:hypothetical protein